MVDLREEERKRYSRQLHMPEIGEAGQVRLREARVVVVGAGGLGSPVSLYLAAAGVGRIILIDDDSVALSNLNRQILYSEANIGDPKARAAAGRLRGLNGEVDVVPVAEQITAENAERLIGGADLVVDGLDSMEARRVVNAACVKQGIAFVHGGVHGFIGEVTTMIPGQTACFECLWPGEAEKDEAGGEAVQTGPGAEAGGSAKGGAATGGAGSAGNAAKKPLPVLGAVAGVIGALEAVEAVKLLTGAGELLAGRLLYFDGASARFETIEIQRREDCCICGGKTRV